MNIIPVNIIQISNASISINSQQLFYYITLKKQRKKQTNNSAALFFDYPYISRVMRKPTFSMYENEEADQLRGNRSACIFLQRHSVP